MFGSTSGLLKIAKKVVLGLLVAVGLYWAYSVSARAVKKLMGATAAEQAKAPGAPVAGPTDFAPEDTIVFKPATGAVLDLTSDRTLDAILSGAFGPAIVMVYADWCSHCRNMMDAYEAAAKAAVAYGVPFVRIQGREAPISSRKYGITGYPTVFGVASVNSGAPRRFMAQRTTEALLEFARGLAGSLAALPSVPLEAAVPVVPALSAPAAPSVPSVPAGLTTELAVEHIAPTVVMVQ